MTPPMVMRYGARMNGSNGVNHPWTHKVLRAGAESAHSLRLRLDSWANALTGLNTNRDKTTAMLPYAEILLSPQLLESMYHTDDIAARIVSAIPDEALKKQWTVVSKASRDDEAMELEEKGAKIGAALDIMGARQKIREAVTWGRLYGLGAILIGVDDGKEPWEPLDWGAISAVRYLTVLDKRDLIPWRWYSSPREPKFGDVALYQMQPVGVFIGMPYDSAAENPIILVHESRLIRFGGELTSKRERLRNQGADYSVLQKCFRALQLTNNNWQSASALLADASQGVFKIKGLIDMISQQPDVMQSRMQVVDQMRSVVRGIVLDTEEDFQRVATPFGGVPDLLEQTWKRLAAAARMPLTVLMGTSPGGLSATGESDMRWWYDQVASTQESVIKPELEYLLRIMATAMGENNAQDWTVVFAPLKQMNEKEQAELHLSQANSDNVYVQAGVLTPEEVALSRFGGGKYALETKIDVESRKRVMGLSLQQMEVDAEKDLDTAANPSKPVATPGVIEEGLPDASRARKATEEPRPPGAVET